MIHFCNGPLARSSAGERTVFLIACLLSNRLLYEVFENTLMMPFWNACLPCTMTWQKHSADQRPRNYHLTALTIAPLTSYLMLHHLRGVSFLCPRPRPCRNISRKSSPKVSSVHPRLLHLLGFFSSRKRMEDSVHVLTTERSMNVPSSFAIHYPWYQLLWNNSAKQDFTPSWICVVLTTWFVSARGMSGRRPFLRVLGTMNIWSCILGFPSVLQWSNHS